MIMAILRFMMMIFGLGIYDKVPTWTNLAGSELRGQRRGPPPSPVQASAPVWPVNPIKLLQRNHALYYSIMTCPAQSIEVSSRKLFPSLAACKWFLLENYCFCAFNELLLGLCCECNYGQRKRKEPRLYSSGLKILLKSKFKYSLFLPEALTGRWNGQPRAPSPGGGIVISCKSIWLPWYSLMLLLIGDWIMDLNDHNWTFFNCELK